MKYNEYQTRVYLEKSNRLPSVEPKKKPSGFTLWYRGQPYLTNKPYSMCIFKRNSLVANGGFNILIFKILPHG